MEDFIYTSLYIDLAGTEVAWLPCDTKKLYKSNLEKQSEKLEKYGWIKNYFTYKFNSNGFRSDEFNQTPDIIALGCSFTIGIGLPIIQTWPYYLSELLNYKVWNLGVGGSSNDTAFRLALHHVPAFKPKIVCLLSTYPERSEIIFRSLFNKKIYFQNLLPNCIDDARLKYYYEFWLSDPANAILNREKNILSIKELCDRNNSLFYYIKIEEIKGIDLARDLLHWGPKTQEIIAKKFCSIINDSKSLSR